MLFMLNLQKWGQVFGAAGKAANLGGWKSPYRQLQKWGQVFHYYIYDRE